MYDVVIVGAGVAGSYTASEISQSGHSVCVLEKHDRAGSKACCTGIVSSECIALLDTAKNIIQTEASSARIFSPSGNCIRVKKDGTSVYILDRPALDYGLAARAQKSGAEFHFSTTVSAILKEPQKLIIQANKDGKQFQIEARAAVLASGAATALTGSIGLGQINSFATGVQTEVSCSADETEVYTGNSIAPGFFAWLVPIGRGKAKAGLLCSGNPRAYTVKFLDFLADRGKIERATYKFSYGAVPLKPLARTYAERIIVVGDAAGQTKPTTGGGIYFGLLCAHIAAGTLIEALKNNDLSTGMLSKYQRSWHKILEQELTVDYWAHRLYSKLNDDQIEFIFGIIQRYKIHESILASPGITFDRHSEIILQAVKHRSVQVALEKLKIKPLPSKKIV